MENKGLLHTDVIRQHTVPRFLLQNFAINTEKRKRGGQIFAINKQTRRVMKMSVNDATVHNRFYNLHDLPTTVSLESLLCLYEGRGASVIQRLISTKNIQGLSEEEKINLARFVTVQCLRSRGEYENQKHIAQELYNSLKSRGITSDEVECYFSEERFEQNTKGNFLDQITNCDFEMAVLMGKEWLLFETTADKPFYISDNPVTLYNETEFSDRSNTGIALKGIQIYLPLSATLMLAMVCPSLNDVLREGRELIYKFILNNVSSRGLNIFERLDFLKCLLDKRLVNIEEWRRTHLNNLQVWRAEQFIFSQKDDFERIGALLDECPELTCGPRSTVS
ncbi:DUF4238 domain-containing protein [Rahnella sp. CG8]|uniref:DUF4238 domain-containing protein n=1 Tax=Yersiniaceae TaxID=1903411 RepID=UPI001013CD91|nr:MULTISPECIES: DUF4238 domain-containing protein [Yersiniaceae]MCM2446228.1 DUF4238 domain-containing protein [Rahnella sp. CG8]